MATIEVTARRPVRGGLDPSTLNAVILSAGLMEKSGRRAAETPDLSALVKEVAEAAPAASEKVSLIGVSDEKKTEHATPWFIGAAYLIVAAGAVLGAFLSSTWVRPSGNINIVDGIGFFAVFYLAAQAIERLVEPLTALNLPEFGSKNKRVEEINLAKNLQEAARLAASPLDQKNEKGAGKSADDAAQKAANQAAENAANINRIKNNTGVLVWGVATFVAMLVSGALGLYLLKAVGVDVAENYRWMDVIITGLAIGAGTKPLHDLISNMKNKTTSAGDQKGGSEDKS
jgi:hypothetical protein